jgi:hypothetical protein
MKFSSDFLTKHKIINGDSRRMNEIKDKNHMILSEPVLNDYLY